MAWTSDMIPDQEGRVVVIAGPHCPRGRATAMILAEHGAHLVLVGGSTEPLRRLRGDLLEAVPTAGVTLQPIADPSMATAQSAGRAIVEINPRVDLVMLNACARLPAETPPLDTVPAVALPALGHLALTAALLPALSRSSRARIVTVVPRSDQAEPVLGTPTWHDVATTNWRSIRAAMTPQDLEAPTLRDFPTELHRRLTLAESAVVSVAVDPGTPTEPAVEDADAGPLSLRLAQARARRRAEPQLWAATDPSALPGQWYDTDGVVEAPPLEPAERHPDQAEPRDRWDTAATFLDIPFDPVARAA